MFNTLLDQIQISAIADALIWNPGNLVIGPKEGNRKTKFGEKFDDECNSYLNKKDKGHSILILELKYMIDKSEYTSLDVFLQKWRNLADHYGFTEAPWKIA